MPNKKRSADFATVNGELLSKRQQSSSNKAVDLLQNRESESGGTTSQEHQTATGDHAETQASKPSVHEFPKFVKKLNEAHERFKLK